LKGMSREALSAIFEIAEPMVILRDEQPGASLQA
jgi:hypothetical protein